MSRRKRTEPPLSAEQLQTVEEACDLWQWAVEKRRALQAEEDNAKKGLEELEQVRPEWPGDSDAMQALENYRTFLHENLRSASEAREGFEARIYDLAKGRTIRPLRELRDQYLNGPDASEQRRDRRDVALAGAVELLVPLVKARMQGEVIRAWENDPSGGSRPTAHFPSLTRAATLVMVAKAATGRQDEVGPELGGLRVVEEIVAALDDPTAQGIYENEPGHSSSPRKAAQEMVDMLAELGTGAAARASAKHRR